MHIDQAQSVLAPYLHSLSSAGLQIVLEQYMSHLIITTWPCCIVVLDLHGLSVVLEGVLVRILLFQ